MCSCALNSILTDEAAEGAVRSHLKKITACENNWNEIYECMECGQTWEMKYPAAGDVCCVEAELVKIPKP